MIIDLLLSSMSINKAALNPRNSPIAHSKFYVASDSNRN